VQTGGLTSREKAPSSGASSSLGWFSALVCFGLYSQSLVVDPENTPFVLVGGNSDSGLDLRDSTFRGSPLFSVGLEEANSNGGELPVDG